MPTRLALLALLCLPVRASADLPPPPDYVESCTIEKQCKAGEEGITCGANHMARDKCQKAYAKDGYVERCKTHGASVWTEVWCRPKAKKK